MRNSNTRKINAIVVLGGGITTDGTLSFATKERLDGLLEEREKLSRVPIVLSGRWSGFIKMEPHTTEAQEMEEYLIKHGIRARQIVKEEKSLDTISNAVFVRKIAEDHDDWGKILLITSDWHMERALWIFRRIFGERYAIIPFAIVSGNTDIERRKEYEKYLLTVAQRFLRDSPTNSKELIRLLKTAHPFYSKSKQAQKLLRDIVSHKKKISA